MNPLLLKVLEVLAPVFLSAYQRATAAHPGEPVTAESLIAEIHANADSIVAEGDAWAASKGRE